MAAGPKPKFVMLGKSKFVHVVRSKAYDLKHSECQQVRKMTVADKIDYKGKTLSAEAAGALDGCPSCGTAAVLDTVDTPEVKREKAKEKAADFTHRFTEENRPKTGKGKAKKVKATKEAKPKREGKARGERSSAGSTQEKADALVAFAKEHGWDAHAVTVEGEPGVLVEASRDHEIINCWFVDGKYDASRMAFVKAGDWTGKLRGVHGCRKQMANEGRDRPHPEPGKGRSGPRKAKAGKHDEQEADVVPDDESPEDARKRVPFLIDDDDVVIIDSLLGKSIRWRNGTSNKMDEATMPSSAKGKKRPTVRIATHPKTGRKVIDFLEVVGNDGGREVYGPERVVALDKIVRVIG